MCFVAFLLTLPLEQLVEYDWHDLLIMMCRMDEFKKKIKMEAFSKIEGGCLLFFFCCCVFLWVMDGRRECDKELG